jgi:sulfate transport system substrate-binding protein
MEKWRNNRKSKVASYPRWFIFCLFLFIAFGCCSGRKVKKSRSLTLAAFTVTREIYKKEIIPSFKKYWKEKTGEDVRLIESYLPSGAQSRAIISGYEADVAVLSLEQDITRLEEAGLITHNWKNREFKGFVTRSVVAICFRPQNPKVIKGWQDLQRVDVDVIFPDPKNSGGGMWCVNAIYGSGLKLSELYRGKKDPQYARDFLKKIQRRVLRMDESGRDSVRSFEKGTGDVLVTYENEALLRQKQGKNFHFIIPESTILIENPAALIDKNVEKHHNRDLAEAFIKFLFSNGAQRDFASYGFRPVNDVVAVEFARKYPRPKYLFEIHYLGGWDHVYLHLYGTRGIWNGIIKELAGTK